MDGEELQQFRTHLGKTQEEMSRLLGVSVRAVHSYEQGWRSVPVHVERQVLFLAWRKQHSAGRGRPCWIVTSCPEQTRDQCPAWEFQAGDLCWFVSGTMCRGERHASWDKKMRHCRSCEMLRPVLRSVLYEGD